MCGTITKLVIFNKQGKEQALVQFERAEDAAVAMERFQGKNIYSGCNTLNIQYSNLPDITVKYNNDRSYDFTNPSLPAGEQGLGGDALLSGSPLVLPPASACASEAKPPRPPKLPDARAIVRGGGSGGGVEICLRTSRSVPGGAPPADDKPCQARAEMVWPGRF